MKIGRILIMVLMLALLAGGNAYALDTATGTMTINATINAKAQLTIPASILFDDTLWNGVTTSIPSAPPAVSITAKVKTGSAAHPTLTCKAGASSFDGGGLIPVSAVKWTTGSAGFVPGTMSDASEVSVASWTGSGSYTGSITPTMDMAWTYPTGTYNVIVTYTLIAP